MNSKKLYLQKCETHLGQKIIATKTFYATVNPQRNVCNELQNSKFYCKCTLFNGVSEKL